MYRHKTLNRVQNALTLTLWLRIVLERQTVVQALRNLPTFMESEGSLPHSQELTPEHAKTPPAAETNHTTTEKQQNTHHKK
jgi:hypothetical protein